MKSSSEVNWNSPLEAQIHYKYYEILSWYTYTKYQIFVVLQTKKTTNNAVSTSQYIQFAVQKSTSLIQEAFSQLSAQESFKQTSLTNFLLPSPRKAVNNFALLAFALNQQRQL